MADKVRWGIIGCGGIAKTFSKALDGSATGIKLAAASRSMDKAKAFALEHGFERAYGSYADMLADPDVDAVYVATPHPVHCACVLDAANAGKHVLCEKPMGVDPAECEQMIAAAERNRVALLEAFMFRCHPQTHKVMELIEAGAIGQVCTVRSCFCYGLGAAYNVRGDLSLRGGGLYDVGCYCINFSRMVAGGEPDQIEAVWRFGEESGVDENLACALAFPSGVVAHFDVGIRNAGGSWGEILGTEGTITIPKPWKPDPDAARFQLQRKGKPAEEVVVENGGNAYTREADHMADVIAGTCDPLIPASNAVGNALVLDTIWQRMHG